MLLQLFGGALGTSASSLSPWVVTPLWLVLAVGCWTVMGAAAGLVLGALGARGGRVLSAVAAPLTWLMRICGLGNFTALFYLQ